MLKMAVLMGRRNGKMKIAHTNIFEIASKLFFIAGEMEIRQSLFRRGRRKKRERKLLKICT
jgi:hypothetical protein